jgi:hypothetical protein
VESHESKLMSIPIAMMMAVVAMLGAVIAYRAALAEQDTLRAERRLQQGKVLELAKRHEMLSTIFSAARYEHSRKVYKAEADNDSAEAKQVSLKDQKRAARLTLQVQRDNAVLRALQPYLKSFQVQEPGSLDEFLEDNAATQLREYGFDTRWVQGAEKDTPVSIWKGAEDYADKQRHRTLFLAGAVVLFVLALASLTFAQLFHFWRRRGSITGMLIALLGLIIAVWADPNSWRTLLPFGAAFFLMRIVGRKLSRKMQFVPREEDEPIHPSEVEPTLFAGVRVHTAPVAHAFGRFTIAMIAITAVLSALSGFLYSYATSQSARAFSETLEQQMALFKAKSREEASYLDTVSAMATIQEYLVRLEAARQRATLAETYPSILNLKQALQEAKRWNQILAALQKESGVDYWGVDGPEQDRNFPTKLLTEGSKESEEAFALSDARNEASLRWQRRGTIYLAILTFFAIALYLFGQGLSMGRTHAAFILVFFSCCLVAYAVGYGLFMSGEIRASKRHASRPECGAHEKSEEDPDHDAARHYAEGMRLYESAGAQNDAQKLVEAAKEFACAVDVRPSFAMGSSYYARSTELASTPQLAENDFVSIVSKQSLRTVLEHEKQAMEMIRQQGFKTPPTLQVGYSFEFLMEGLVQRNRKTVEDAVEETRNAVALDDTDLPAKFNLGLALLASGKKKEGTKTYEQIIHSIPTIQWDLEYKRDLVASAITDLETLRQYCYGISQNASDCVEMGQQTIPRLKAEMITALWPVEAQSTSAIHPKIADIKLNVTESRFGWRASDPNLDRKHDVLSVLWYAYSPEWETWRVLPALSDIAGWKPDGQGRIADVKSALRGSGGRNCVARGKDDRYRAELYLNGELAGTKDLEMKDETLQYGKFLPMAFRSLNLALCYPDSWVSWESPELPPGSWIKGYTDHERTQGIFLFTYFNPRHQPDGISKTYYLIQAASYLVGHNLAPRPRTVQVIPRCEEQSPEPGETLTEFNDGTGSATAKVWMENDGLTHVAVVFDRHKLQANCDALMSVTNLD